MNQVIEHQLDNHILHCSHHLHENIRDYIEMQWWDEAKPQIGHTLPELVLEEEVLPKVHCTVLCSPRYTVMYSAPQGTLYCTLLPKVQPLEQTAVLTLYSGQVLADVFESLMAAVYLDSGQDLDTVWRVYNRLCPHLDILIEDPVCPTEQYYNWEHL